MPLTSFLALVALGQEMDGQAVLDKMAANLAKHTSVTGVAFQHFGGQKAKLTFKAMRPNYFAASMQGAEIWQSGRKVYMYYSQMNQYQEQELTDAMKDIGPASMLNGFEPVLTGDPQALKAKPGAAKKVEFEGKQAWEVAYVVEGNVDEIKNFLYVDSDTFLPLGYEHRMGEQGFKMSYEDVVLGADLKESDFAWTPPAGAKVYEQPDYNAKLLKVGETAPDFTLKTPDGKEIKLSEKLKEGKGVLVNFWFYG